MQKRRLLIRVTVIFERSENNKINILIWQNIYYLKKKKNCLQTSIITFFFTTSDSTDMTLTLKKREHFIEIIKYSSEISSAIQPLLSLQ